ncbi:hypothetical protein SEA_GODONK_117 [Gordonia phage GodonK]|uniref:Uncharacterized protein n=1 Tax=Gordonia phage GodonK TaxID=2562192 RepID=A0A4D6E299_9CAUD|nr:hypothetical protein HOV33_gp117 [Gordonia phage GodonK]QBZ72736.1 hypothetical protein SEA_GODONK_117 [Gordonia phage GodonK]
MSSDDYCCACYGCPDHDHECDRTEKERAAAVQAHEDLYMSMNDKDTACEECGLGGGWHRGDCEESVV